MIGKRLLLSIKNHWGENLNQSILMGYAQHIGKREEQQDSFGFSDMHDSSMMGSKSVLAVVADGMGGMKWGREASQLAVGTVLSGLKQGTSTVSVPQILSHLMFRANDAVYEMARGKGYEGYAGSTLVCVVIDEGWVYWASVGDSRIYLYRDNRMMRMTEDNIYAKKLEKEILKGSMRREEAEKHPERNSLTSYLGLPFLEQIEFSCHPLRLMKDDRILLCSDGLYGTLRESDMIQILRDERVPQKAAKELVRRTLGRNKPCQDNVTAVVLQWNEVDSRHTRIFK